MTQAERSAHQQRMQAIAQQREADKAQRQQDAATAAAQRWEAAEPAPRIILTWCAKASNPTASRPRARRC